MLSGLTLFAFATSLTLRAYVPPALEPEPAFVRSDVSIIEVLPANGDWDANVIARPSYKAPLVGNVARGARLKVRGEVRPPDGAYCETGVYYALEPFGWLCSADTKPSAGPVTSEQILQVVPNTPVPYRYVMVVVPEGSSLPMWGSVQELWDFAEPERQLGRGDTIALSGTVEEFEGERYYLSVDGKVVPAKGTTELTNYSDWQGVQIDINTHLPFGWTTPKSTPVYDAPKGQKIDELERRTRLDVLEEVAVGSQRWLRIGEGRYVKADHLNEVRVLPRPAETMQHAQWVDVDLNEQVVVAYVSDKPVYATLTSSGRAPNNTPRGNYPVWGKATAITMKSQEYDDSPYYVNRVPWVMFFQAHNALHAAYWHDRFGATKSHGCANLSPSDARILFDWLEPKLPPGWTSVRFWDLTKAPVVHVRNSKKTKQLVQERNIGPPAKEDEALRLEQAVARRELEAQQAAQMAIQGPLAEPPKSPLGTGMLPVSPQLGPSPLLR